MGVVGQVEKTELTDGLVEVTCDPGGGASVTAEHYGPVGDDSPPLPGDWAALEASAGSGAHQASGYADPVNASQAEAGEVRRYARNSTGVPVAELWLKSDGTIEVTPLLPGIKVKLAGEEAFLARADRVDAEIDRLWTVLTTFVPAGGDGGAALKTKAIDELTNVQSTESDNVKGT